jgi:hypothetical protein
MEGSTNDKSKNDPAHQRELTRMIGVNGLLVSAQAIHFCHRCSIHNSAVRLGNNI